MTRIELPDTQVQTACTWAVVKDVCVRSVRILSRSITILDQNEKGWYQNELKPKEAGKRRS